MGTHTDPFYELNWASRRNLDIPQYSDIVYRPATTEDVAAAVKCAYDNHATVQARSGGHSFGYIYPIPSNEDFCLDTLRRLDIDLQ
jgi:FAD/FMN-containing dehydrogenase